MDSPGWLWLLLQRNGLLHPWGATVAVFSPAVLSPSLLRACLGAAQGREGVGGTWYLCSEVWSFAWWLSQATLLLWAFLLAG